MIEGDKHRKRLIVGNSGLHGFQWLDYIWRGTKYTVAVKAMVPGDDQPARGADIAKALGYEVDPIHDGKGRWLVPLRDYTYDFKRQRVTLCGAWEGMDPPLIIQLGAQTLGDPRQLRRGMHGDIYQRNKRPALYGILNRSVSKDNWRWKRHKRSA